jgi:hypothetical protein
MAGVFETLYLLFDADTDGLKKGENEAKKSTDNIAEMFTGVAKAAAAAFGVAAISSKIMNQAALNDQLGDTASLLGVNAQQLDLWSQAAVMADGTAEGFQASLKSLAGEAAAIATKGTSRLKPFFDELGISMVDADGKARDVMQVLPELAEAFEGLGKQESLGMGRKMGLDEGTIMLLQRGRRGVEELTGRMEALGVVSEAATEAAGAYDEQSKVTARIFELMASKATEYVLPALTAIHRGFEMVYGFIQKHPDLIKGVGIAFGVAGAVIFASYVPAMWAAASATLATAAPFLAVAAAVGAIGLAFALAWEDIQVWRDGGDSLIGSWFGNWNDYSSQFGDNIETMIGWITKLVDMFLKAKNVVSSGFGMTDAIGWAAGKGANIIEKGAQMIGLADSSPINSTTSSAITNGNSSVSKDNSVKIDKIEVNTQATDAEGISKGLMGGLQQHFSAAIDQSDDGLLA